MAQIIAHSLDSCRTKDVIFEENVSFESLLLNDNLLKGLTDSGFKKPSPIQVKAIPIGRCGFDLIVRSKSGTGKTLVYSVIALETIEVFKNQTQVLILAPTREIVVQIQEVLLGIGRYIEGLCIKAFIGGLPLEEDIEKCKGCHIAVGAPGRVKHLIADGFLKTNAIRLFVLDEVDKLMESSFVSDINQIYNSIYSKIQTITTSATYSDELKKFLHKYMLSPIYIVAEDDTALLWGLKQFVVVVKQHTSIVQQMKLKTEEILKLLSKIAFTQCIIFTNYQTRAESVSNTLNLNGWSSMYISAARSQAERLTVVKDLRNFNCRILLSTDLTARGIDAANVDLVINYDVPIDSVTYLHRMGRAGRYGSSGICLNLVSEGLELQHLQSILGEIGGSSLSIPKLPNFSGSVQDLLNVKVSFENHINGTLLRNISKCDIGINKDISYLDEIRHKSKKQNKEQKEYSSDLKISSSEKCNIAEDYILDILNDTKKEEELICKQFSDTDTRMLLKSLALDESNMSSMSTSTHWKTSPCSNLQQLISVNRSREGKKLLFDKNCQVVDLESNYEQKLNTTDDILYTRNKTLLWVSQMITSKRYHATVDDLKFLQCYLRNIKDKEKNECQVMMRYTCHNVTDILKEIDQIKISQDDINLKENNLIENIFKVGYDSIVNTSSKHWRTYFLESEEKIKKCDHSKKIVKEADDHITEENYNKNKKNKFINCYITEEENLSKDFMKWVPVEKCEKTDTENLYCDVTNWEYFYLYFKNCSDCLWHNGLNFENVKDFDNWFDNQWQMCVYTIRNYIQQNIYVQELNKHQETKNNN